MSSLLQAVNIANHKNLFFFTWGWKKTVGKNVGEKTNQSIKNEQHDQKKSWNHRLQEKSLFSDSLLEVKEVIPDFPVELTKAY